MSNKNLKYFLKHRDPEIVEIKAPDGFVGEDGKPLMMKVRVLTQEEIDHIYENYTTKRTATDKKKKPLVDGGELVVRRDRDSGAALRHVVAEALIDPDLTSDEVMKFYDCYDASMIVYKMFPTTEEFNYVITEVLKALGISGEEDDEDDFEKAKN